MTLTTALAIAAVVALLALALHGWWRVRRARPKAAAGSSRFAASTLEERHEPTMDMPGGGPPTLEDAVTEPGALPDGVLSPAATARAALRRTPRLDALIDALVPLVLDAPTSAEQVLAHAPASRRAGSKPFYIEGLDTETGEWEPLTPGRRYGELQAGVQLANRGGPLNEIEYSEFVQKVEALAESLGARADMPDMLEVVARARELDSLAAPLDAQLAITLRSNGVAWSVGFVQQVAQRATLKAGAVPGRWVLPSDEEGAPPVLVLAVDAQAALAAADDSPPAAAVREALLLLDVPQTPAAVEPFPAWHLLSKQLCDDLDATACDDQGQPITLHAFDTIGREIDGLYGRLEQLGLPAGSPAARRLFS
jgi:hypothetical protein